MTPTAQFITTLGQTPVLSSALLANLHRLKNNLGQILTVLGYSKTVDDDLIRLDDALTTAKDLLTIVSVIPEVGQAASGLRNAVNALSQQVGSARRAADRIESVVKPLREALTPAQHGLDRFIGLVETIKSTSATFLAKFTAVANCINSLPNGTYKTQGQNYLNEFSTEFEPDVDKLNRVLSAANTAIERFYSQLDALRQALIPFRAISEAVRRVLDVLNPVIGVLQRLKDALMSIKITIPILPYPIEVSLYDIFKDFSTFADLALKPIQALVNEVLSALHIRLPSIPGLTDLINLNFTRPVVPDFPAFENVIEQLYDRFKPAIPSFTLTCPPRNKDDQVPGGGKFHR